MTTPLHHSHETQSNAARDLVARYEPKSLRTYTPSQAVIAKSAGIYHWTPEGRRLYDFTSGVLVSNLGHNPTSWMTRFGKYMQWPGTGSVSDPYIQALPMTAYNAVTPIETKKVTGFVLLSA